MNIVYKFFTQNSQLWITFKCEIVNNLINLLKNSEKIYFILFMNKVINKNMWITYKKL